MITSWRVSVFVVCTLAYDSNETTKIYVYIVTNYHRTRKKDSASGLVFRCLLSAFNQSFLLFLAWLLAYRVLIFTFQRVINIYLSFLVKLRDKY